MRRIIIVAIALTLLGVGCTKQSPTVSVVPPVSTPPSFELVTTTLHFKNNPDLSLNILNGYEITVAAEGLKEARFMAMSPDNRLFVADMHSRGDNSSGDIMVFENFSTTTGAFTKSSVYLKNLRNPNSVAFYTDTNNQTWIYIPLTDKLIRYRYMPGDTQPTGAPEVLATFPDYGNAVQLGGWHITRTITFHDDMAYVSIGSSCNSCEEKAGEIRAEIIKMHPDGSGQTVVANGLRNAVGLTFVGNDLFATAMGVDHLGNDRPNDLLYKIAEGTNYGWPYCFESNGAVFADTSTKWKADFDCSMVPTGWSYFPPHSAPLDLAYIGQSFDDPRLKDSFLVALHGSGKPAIGTGYAVVKTTAGGANETIMSGFLKNGKQLGRPAGILINDNTSFFVSDDQNGVVYFLKKR